MAPTAEDGETPGMDRNYAIAITRREAERMLDVVSSCPGGLDTPAPTCADWSVQELVGNLAGIYNRVGTVLDRLLVDRPAPEDLPSKPEDVGPVDWLADRLRRLLEAEALVPEDVLVWNFGPQAPGPPSFWFRRMVHETVIHRVDAELAAGLEVSGLEPEVAADTISELFMLIRFSDVTGDADHVPADGESHLSIHLHATDLDDAEWTCDTGRRTVARRHAKGDVALRGPAWSLARWFWGRSPVDQAGIDVFGDLARADAWRAAVVP